MTLTSVRSYRMASGTCRLSQCKMSAEQMQISCRHKYCGQDKQHRQCTYTVTLPWKSNKYYIVQVCVCTLKYLVCKVHAPYCHLWPIQLHHIFWHLVNDDFQEKSYWTLKCVLVSSTTSACHISHSKKNWARYDHKRILVFMSSKRYFVRF